MKSQTSKTYSPRLHKKLVKFKAALVAPCGMNCNVCSGYLALTHEIPKARGRISHCRGCGRNGKMCAYLRTWCAPLRNDEVRFCFQCADFPCSRLKHLDGRYRDRYSVSLIDNLKFIRSRGIQKFLRAQQRLWRCPKCRTDVRSIHNGKCYSCNRVRSWRG